MDKLQTYRNYANHGRTFNTYFSTILTVLASIVVGTFLYDTKILNEHNAPGIMLILISAPILVFIAGWNNYSLRVAFPKTWKDMFQGRIDRKKLLQNFAKTYHIDTWQTKITEIDADGRWKFNAETPYIQHLAEERDTWISLLYQECANDIADIDKQIIEKSKDADVKNINVGLASRIADETEDRLNDAKSSGEIYFQRQVLNRKRASKMYSEQEALSLERLVEKLKVDRANYIDVFSQSASRIVKSYNRRYEKYTESAIKTINKINKLHYKIQPMTEPSLRDYERKLTNGII